MFPLSSSFEFPSSFLSDHSDPLKISELSLNANHQDVNKTLFYSEAVAARVNEDNWKSRVPGSIPHSEPKYFQWDTTKSSQLTVIPYNSFLCTCMEHYFLYRKLQTSCHSEKSFLYYIIQFTGNAVNSIILFVHNLHDFFYMSLMVNVLCLWRKIQ